MFRVFNCSDKIITGSFDKKCNVRTWLERALFVPSSLGCVQVWDAKSGALLHSLGGHEREIVCVAFNPHGNVIATGSTDNTAKLWDVGTGKLICTLAVRTELAFAACPRLLLLHQRMTFG